MALKIVSVLRWQLTYLFDGLYCWFRDKTGARVVKNNGYVAVLQVGNGETFEVLRENRNMTREEFLNEYAVGDVRYVGFWRWCLATFLMFIADRMIDTYAMLDKVLERLGLSADEMFF
jgi:hypothetical protein